MDYRVENGVVVSPRGIPVSPRWFADGRLAFSYDEGGIQTLEYYGNRSFDGNNILFQRGIFDSFRCFLLQRGCITSPSTGMYVCGPLA